MKPILKVLAPIVFLLLSTLTSQVWGATQSNSQELRVQQSKLIVFGDVAYVAKPNPSLTSPYATHQVVVFRVREVVKGDYPAHAIRVSLSFYFDDNSPLLEQKSGNAFRLSSGVFKKGSKWLIFLEGEPQPELKKSDRRFINFCEEPAPAAKFQRYLKVPCYAINNQSLSRAGKNEMQSMRALFNKR